MSSGNAHYILYALTSNGVVAMRIEFGRSTTSYRIRAELRNNSANYTSTSWFNINDSPHVIEVDWRAATGVGANDGGMTLWIDGVQQANITGVNNNTRRIETIRLGAVDGIDSGTRGVEYLDAFVSHRSTYIGP
jgi:hypothetical protein